MGYSTEARIELDFDRTQMEREAVTDTSTSINFNDRIEFQLLQTQKRLQEDNLNYYEWGFIPSINVFGGYSMNYQSSFVDQLYSRTYPISFIGLQLSFPLFQGGKRIQEIKQAKLQLDRIDYDFLSLKNSINSQYAAALANYKSNLNFYKVLSDNLQLAQDVYRTIQLQYKDGTKSYLEYITAETDLRTAQVNQTDALYQLLAGKLDLQKATGTVSY